MINHKSRIIYHVSVLLAAIFATACATSSKDEMKLSESQEYYAGRAAAAKALTAVKLYTCQNPELLEYVTKIGYCVALNSDRAELFEGYNFAIIDDNTINAFTFPSGFIFISTGSIRHAKNEDELAAVIAHEIAHVNLRHPEISTINELKKTQTAETLSALAGIGMTIFNIFQASKGKEPTFSQEQIEKLSGALGDVAGSLGSVIVKGYDRDQELDADFMAVELLARSGYNPGALIEYLKRLGPQDQSTAGWLNASHPSPQDRIERIKDAIVKNEFKPVDPSPRQKRFLHNTRELTQQ